MPPAQTLPPPLPVCSCGRVAGGGSLSSLDVWVAISPSAEKADAIRAVAVCNRQQTDEQIIMVV